METSISMRHSGESRNPVYGLFWTPTFVGVTAQLKNPGLTSAIYLLPFAMLFGAISAFVTAESTLILDPEDAFCWGIPV